MVWYCCGQERKHIDRDYGHSYRIVLIKWSHKVKSDLVKIFATQERSLGRDILIWALTCSFVIPSCPIGQSDRTEYVSG